MKLPQISNNSECLTGRRKRTSSLWVSKWRRFQHLENSKRKEKGMEVITDTLQLTTIILLQV